MEVLIMAARRNPFRHIRLKFHRSSPKLKILVLTALIVCTVTLLALSIGISVTKARTEALRREAAALEQENAALSEDIREFGTVKSIKELAKKFLGLLDPDTVIFSPED